MHLKSVTYLLFVALIVGAAGGAILPGASIPLATVESKQTHWDGGNATIVAYTSTGVAYAANFGYKGDPKLGLGFDYLSAQIPLAAVGRKVKPVHNLANGKPVGSWLPQRHCWVVKGSEIADQIGKAAVEATERHLPYDARVWQVDFEVVRTIEGGNQDKYTLFVFISFTVTHDQPVSQGFSLYIQNTTGWDPNSRADFHRPEADLRAEIMDWHEAGITGFEPVSDNPGSQARGERRDQQLRDGALRLIRIRYEERDGSLARGIVPRDTCLYWYIDPGLVLSDTQLAISFQEFPGQRYQLLPVGREPELPTNWTPAIRDQLRGLRCVKISRTFSTGSEVPFEMSDGMIDLAPPVMIGPEGQRRVVSNFLVLGCSHAGANGDPRVWRYVKGGGSDLVSFFAPPLTRQTCVEVRLCPSTAEERAQVPTDTDTPPAPLGERP